MNNARPSAKTASSDHSVTVVIPTYERRDTVERALRSVLCQRNVAFSVVVVDDGSSDGTSCLLDSINDDRVHDVWQPNAGRCSARNVGASLAEGNWLVFLDSDDELLPGSLMRFVERFNDCELVIAPTQRRATDGSEELQGPSWDGRRNLPWAMQAGAFAIKRTLFDRIGGYCEELEFSEHTEMTFMFRRLDPQPVVAVIDHPTVRIHERAGRYDPATQYRTAVHLMHHVGPELADDQFALARFHGIAGVAASRLGMRRSALNHLWKSFLADRSATGVGRIVRAVVKPPSPRLREKVCT
jgi:glycosyltransferase involved in cell wall biosynthesis